MAILTWRTFRQSNQPSLLLIGNSVIRDVSSDMLVDTEVVCLPGGGGDSLTAVVLRG